LSPSVPFSSASDWMLVREKRRYLEAELGHESERRGHDHEFRLRDMLIRWVRACARPTIADVEARTLADDLARHEIKLEACATLPTPRIAKALETARLHAPRQIGRAHV